MAGTLLAMHAIVALLSIPVLRACPALPAAAAPAAAAAAGSGTVVASGQDTTGVAAAPHAAAGCPDHEVRLTQLLSIIRLPVNSGPTRRASVFEVR